MVQFSFILTEECNWDCEYCMFPHIKNPSGLTFDKIQKHIPYIKSVIDKVGLVSDHVPQIEIQGGELGLIPPGILSLFLKGIGCKVSVSTNGLLLGKEYHLMPHIRPYIKDIVLHLCDRPGAYSIPDYADDVLPIIRGIVHNDIQDMVNFIVTNEHITFDYVEMEYDIQKHRTSNTDDYRVLWNLIQHLPNVTDKAKERLQNRFHEDDDLRNKCINYNSCISINLANETICLCQRAPEINIPLTEQNLLNRLTTFPKDLFKGISKGCNSCTRLYIEKHKKGIETTLVLRRRLK